MPFTEERLVEMSLQSAFVVHCISLVISAFKCFMFWFIREKFQYGCRRRRDDSDPETKRRDLAPTEWMACRIICLVEAALCVMSLFTIFVGIAWPHTEGAAKSVGNGLFVMWGFCCLLSDIVFAIMLISYCCEKAYEDDETKEEFYLRMHLRDNEFGGEQVARHQTGVGCSTIPAPIYAAVSHIHPTSPTTAGGSGSILRG